MPTVHLDLLDTIDQLLTVFLICCADSVAIFRVVSK